jgi:hypothetical protein
MTIRGLAFFVEPATIACTTILAGVVDSLPNAGEAPVP